MKKPNWIIGVCLLVFPFIPVVAQNATSPTSAEAASPEMERVAKAFVGDWKTTESMDRGDLFPQGGGRSGKSQWRLAAGGTTLVGEGQSDGSVGPLWYLITIWWDRPAKVYRFFTCFRDSRGSSCKVRGTAHWERDSFVNDYEEVEHGKKTKWRDAFVEITPTFHKLLAGRLKADGTLQTLITSTSTRK
ncbi:MAG TPA: hypothetical protein VE994_06915 [Terriglobales bacterium]|nr:hypothetical protein [Terriglobales bacterium]